MNNEKNPSPAAPVIETVKLTKVFKDFWHRDKVRAVDSLSLKIYPGQVFGLLGPNGSGKTTTLKLMLGLLFPTKGIVRIFGRPPGNVAVKSRIGFLPEESYFYKHLSADETMDFYGSLFELPSEERRRRGRRLLQMLGLLPSRTRPVGEYSKGMMRRIGLAQALINDPELVILDEPTGGLDPIGRREVKNLILRLKKLGKTVLLSSHLLSEVQDVCDRICIMYAGRKIAEGEVNEVLMKKEIAQISFPGVSREKVEKIKEYAARETGSDDVRVGTPVETLEEFFLREIAKLEEGQKRAPRRAGKQADGEFSILDELTRDREPSGDVPSEQEQQDREPAGRDKKPREVLDGLVRKNDDSGEDEEPHEREKKRDGETRRKEVFKKLINGGEE